MLIFATHGRSDTGDPAGLALRNFHPPEPEGFAWSAGRWCELEFVVDPAGLGPGAALALALDLDVFRHPPLLPSQDLLVFLNGLRLGAVTVTHRQLASFRLRPGLLEVGPNRLTIDTPEAARPVEFGQGDTRLLGVKLFSLMLSADRREPAEPVQATGAMPFAAAKRGRPEEPPMQRRARSSAGRRGAAGGIAHAG